MHPKLKLFGISILISYWAGFTQCHAIEEGYFAALGLSYHQESTSYRLTWSSQNPNDSKWKANATFGYHTGSGLILGLKAYQDYAERQDQADLQDETIERSAAGVGLGFISDSFYIFASMAILNPPSRTIKRGNQSITYTNGEGSMLDIAYFLNTKEFFAALLLVTSSLTIKSAGVITKRIVASVK